MFYSVIIPTYNQSQWIEESVFGILNQSFKDFELIVSDDSEDDVTKEKISKISDPRLIYKKNSPRLGRVGNYRESVLKYAKGDWCLICDGDDFIFEKDYLQNCFTLIKENPSVVLVQSGHLVGENFNSAKPSLPNIGNSLELIRGIDYFLNFESFKHFSHLSTISNLKFLKKIDPFRLNILSADIETYLRLTIHGDIILIKKAVGLWRQHDNNASKSESFDEHLRNIQSILESGKYLMEKTRLKIIFKTYKSRALNSLVYLLKNKDFKFDSNKYFNSFQVLLFLLRHNLFWVAISNRSFLFYFFKFFSRRNIY